MINSTIKNTNQLYMKKGKCYTRIWTADKKGGYTMHDILTDRETAKAFNEHRNRTSQLWAPGDDASEHTQGQAVNTKALLGDDGQELNTSAREVKRREKWAKGVPR